MKIFVLSIRPEEKAQRTGGACFDILNVPVTRLEPIPVDYTDLIRSGVDCVAFTSSYGVRLFFKNAPVKNFRYFGIGKSTCEEVRKYGYDCEYPEKMDSEGLADMIISHCSGRKVALIRSANANEIVNEKIMGHVDFIDLRNYRAVNTNVDLTPYMAKEECMGIIVTSSMEAKIAMPAIKATGKPVYSIGSVTTKTLEEAGIHPAISGNSDFVDLVEKIKKYLCLV
ncbi:hypothetical protein [Thermoplasma acidophilum]|uniref:Tetrapyrrole biosynthesis uroporphyrinogen III synthase domain-containing protein n=1 Tax=Thermoplasma acidophilum (strain ATCC 25905 / DSM 1728 / JCM 9062 / NBRC 15155 / AMRC-C165) TaxID=273075 RepID=Q9HKM4_THEAC|nr:uroporphyrinogen-III synthase [Thermoplasma acidophilum]CAC11713.1 hypothetical protein [Thermoplasma acidophilum]